VTPTREELEEIRQENMRLRGIGNVAPKRKYKRNRKVTPRKTDPDTNKFRLYCKANGVPMPTTEHAFAAPERRWRFDYAWIEERVALECEGAVWSGGRHTRGSGYLKDMEKYNAAALRGWLLIRATPKTLCTEETIAMVRQALNQRKAA
jgi:hypothetical protein